MDDLISRTVALDAIDGIKPMQGSMEQLAMKALCWAAVKTTHAVDAVPVVCCRDCKFYYGVNEECGCNCGYHSEDWYCADGERRDSE